MNASRTSKASCLVRMLRRSATLGALLAATANVPQANAAMILIDDFIVSQQVVATAASPTASSSTTAPEAIGGERDMLVNLTGGFTSLSLNSNPFGGELLIHDSGATVTGFSMTVWDGPDMDAGSIDYTGLGGIDLTDGGSNNAFETSVLSADLSGILQMTVYDASDATGNTWSRTEFNLPGNIFSPVDVKTFFADFTDVGSGGAADFTNVGAITFMIENETSGSLDVLVTSIKAVPEPSCLASLVVGTLFCFGRVRRMRLSV